MLTSSKSSISHFIMRLVMLSRIVCSSDWYPSSSSSLSSSSSSPSSTLRLAACRMFCSHRRQWTVQLRRWPWGKKPNCGYQQTNARIGRLNPGAQSEYQWLLEVDLVSVRCDAWFQFHRGQKVLFRLVVASQLQIQIQIHRHDVKPTFISTDRWKHLLVLLLTDLWEEGLHDGAGKLRVASENIVEPLKQARVQSQRLRKKNTINKQTKHRYLTS